MVLKNFEQFVGSEFCKEARLFAQKNFPVSTWQSLYAIGFDYLVILSMAAISIQFRNPMVYALAVVVIAGRQHGLLALLHDGAHGLLSRNTLANHFIADIFCALPFGNSFKAFANGHLAHHKFLNTEKDPEWSKKVLQGWVFPMSKSKFARFVFVEAVVRNTRGRIVKFYSLFSNSNFSKKYRVGIAFFYISLAAVLTYFQLGRWFLLYWLVPALVLLPYLSFTRGLAEHFGLDQSTELQSSRDVRSSFGNRFFFPHRSSFHLTHHLFPRVPCFYLQKMHQYLMRNEEFKIHSKQNDGYYLADNSVLRDVFEQRPAKDLLA